MTARTRSVSDPGVTESVVVVHSWDHPDWVSPARTFNTSEGIMHDVVTHDYKKRSARGDIINNPMTKVETELSAGGGLYSYVDGDRSASSYAGSVTLMADYYGKVGFVPLETLNVSMEAAKLQAISAIDSTPYEFLEDVFEIRETIRFLRSPLKSLRKLTWSMKMDIGTPRTAGLLAARTSDAWLEYRFAVTPLVHSAYDLIQALSKPSKPPPDRRTARGLSVESQLSSEDKTGYGWHFSRSIGRQLSARAGILYSISNPANEKVFKYGVRMKDIPKTLWAVVPYSFMVDRVANITKSIEAITNLADPRVKILSSWTSTSDSYKRTLKCTGRNDIHNMVFHIIGDDAIESVLIKKRRPWQPSLIDTVPQFELSGLVDDSVKVADLLALITSNIKRRQT